ncbi:MAG: hypothetical protein JWQ78_729 [Sediminibacterium sp.]|nr:hypothetical protein [Sediminibacterium sp.]
MRNFLRELRLRNKRLYYFGLINLLGVVVCLVLTQFTDVRVLGINAWIKPAKFLLSTTIFCWTLAWFLAYLREKTKAATYSWMVILVLSFENIYICICAARGELSHFNVSSSFGSIMFSLMGVAITILTLWTGYIGWLFLRSPYPGLPRHYVWGIRFGIFFFVIFALGGHAMASMLGHTVGAPDGGPGLPFVNWSKEHGDLRIAHFLGMHSLQVLPLFGYYISKNSIVTVLVSIVYFLLVTAIFLQAFMGKALMHFYYA